MKKVVPFQSVVTWDRRYHPTLAEGRYFRVAQSSFTCQSPLLPCPRMIAVSLSGRDLLFTYLLTPTCHGKKNGGAFNMLLSSS